jgi:hypothetical protein
MSDISVSSITSGTTTLAESLSALNNSNKSSIISSLSSSDDLTETLCSLSQDQFSFSAISMSLNAISKTVQNSEIDESVMDTVKSFAISMQNDGYSTVSMLQYLNSARNLAETDPDKFTEIFSSDSTTSSTTTSLSS